MLSVNEVTEIFCLIDEFSKEFDKTIREMITIKSAEISLKMGVFCRFEETRE